MDKDKKKTEEQLSDVEIIVKAFTHTRDNWTEEEMEEVRNFAYDLVWRIGALPLKKRAMFEKKVQALYKQYENYAEPTLHMAKRDLFGILDEIEAETAGDESVYQAPEPIIKKEKPAPAKPKPTAKPPAKAPKELQNPQPKSQVGVQQELFLSDDFFLGDKDEEDSYEPEPYSEDDSAPDLSEFMPVDEPKQDDAEKRQLEEQKAKQTQVNVWIKELKKKFSWDASNKEHTRIVQRAAWGIIDGKLSEEDFFNCGSLEEMKSLLFAKCGADALNDKKKK